jgi:hypothetical protein
MLHDHLNGYFATSIEMQRVAAALTIEADDLNAAHARLRAYDRWLARSGSVPSQAEGQLLWATYYRAGGDTNQATHHALQAFSHANEPHQPLALLATHRLLGELDTEAQHFADARRRSGRACGRQQILPASSRSRILPVLRGPLVATFNAEIVGHPYGKGCPRMARSARGVPVARGLAGR